MRHVVGDEIYVTNGCGNIFITRVSKLNISFVELLVQKTYNYENRLKSIFFCIPKLKNPERFEFILEKCTELGITNFIIYDAERAISKGNKIERWNKILLSAMKQSLRSYLPKISLGGSIEKIYEKPGLKLVFEQNSKLDFEKSNCDLSNNSYFIFGPEGGLSERELGLFSDFEKYNLADNRLRVETAVIKCASLL